MKCNHCGSEWTTTTESKKTTCPFCGKQLENVTSSQPAARGRFQLSYDQKTLVQFLGDEKNVVIPTGITRIGAGAFHGYGVETVYIPDGVTEIGDNCFNGCKQLREVRITSSVTYISDSAFKDTGKKKIIAEKGSYAWNKYAKPVADKPATVSAPVEEKPVRESAPITSAKPAEEPKKTVVPTGNTDAKEAVKAHSAGNAPSAKELLEKQLNAPQTLQGLRRQNNSVAEKSTTTNKPTASKTEATQNKTTKKPAAVTQNQEAAWAVALGFPANKRPWIVGIDIFGITEKKVIKRIAYVDDDNMLWHIVAKTDNRNVSCAAVKRIKNQEMLRKLAQYNKDACVRALAAERLPKGELLSVFLQQAAQLSRKMTPYTLEAFQKNIQLLRETNPSCYKEIAPNYPSPGIQYLLRGSKEAETCEGMSMEERLKMQTPSQEEMRQREEIAHCRYMLDYVRSSATHFAESCERAAANGEQNYTSSYGFGDKSSDDAYLFASMLETELKLKGFSSASVAVKSQYRYSMWEKKDVLVGYTVNASVWW